VKRDGIAQGGKKGVKDSGGMRKGRKYTQPFGERTLNLSRNRKGEGAS